MSVDVNTYSMQEFRFAYKPETTIGSKLNSTMQLVQLAGDVTVAKQVVQDTTPRGGQGRTLKTADVHTTDKGGQRTVITVPIIWDTTIAAVLMQELTWNTVGSSPGSYDIEYNYAPTAQAHGDNPGSANCGTLTCCLISPVTDESRYWVGACLEAISFSASADTDGGRMQANLTFVTEYREADATTAPTSPSAYGSTYRYLYDMQTKKSVGGVDVIMNKFELTITNPVSYAGFQGSDGDPELVTRGIGGVQVNSVIGVKHDPNTANFWESHRAGDTIAVEISNHATWASATMGFKAQGKINADVAPSETDQGAFQDVPLLITAPSSGDLFQWIP